MVSIREITDQIWLASFTGYDSGFIRKDEGRVKPAVEPAALTKCFQVSGQGPD